MAILSALLGLVASSAHAELPVLHLRKASTPPPILATLQDPAAASAWYGASPTWFGMGGLTPVHNHTEVLATYDDSALYIAFMDIDRSTQIFPKATSTPLNTVDSNAIWIQTPAGRSFYFIASIDTNYPPQPIQASGEFPIFDPKTDKLSGWTHQGWYAGDKTMQQSIRIPWSVMGTTAPASGARWRVNFVNYNQTSSTLSASTVYTQKWTAGTETQPDQWGTLAFDEAAYTKSSVSPEATLTLKPATGYGDEVTLRAGNAATETNHWNDACVTESNWNDWDPIDYTIKEYMQYDLSLIPKDRKIISATLRNHFRSNFNAGQTDEYLHVVRLDSSYDPKTVTMLTSPLPMENGYRGLVSASQSGQWVDFDVTEAISTAFTNGQQKVSFALAGSSGDINNGKIWDTSFGRADWYDQSRPMLVITFGKSDATYSAPVAVGSGNYTSVATTSSKNKLTNGTFRYGILEGISNTTYWRDPGSAYVNGVNTPYLVKAGDINPNTGDPAVRYNTPGGWQSITQKATGINPGRTYTFSGWYKGSASGIKSDVRLNFKDANGNSLASGQAVYSGSGNWEKVICTVYAPANTAYCMVDVVNWTNGDGQYMLYSDFQLEEGSTPTAYSETMGVYYPDYPRADGTVVVIPTPVVTLTMMADKTQAKAGETLTYTITYRNIGAGSASAVNISCPIPQYTTYVNGSATMGGTFWTASKTVTWTLNSIGAGNVGILTFKVKVD